LLSPGTELEGAKGVYRVVRLVKKGGMGLIYEGESSEGLRVAIKIPNPEGDLASLSQRLRCEIEALKRLDHRCIVRFVDEGLLPWRIRNYELPFLVMEYVSGRRLSEVGRLELVEGLRVFLRILEAVAHMHRREVVHGDIKPSNVILADRPVLIDFGTAMTERCVPSRKLYLTRRWASPEQLERGEVSKASDVYQLGMLLYYILTGDRSGEGRPKPSLFPERVREGTVKIVAKALSRDPGSRFKDADEMLEAFREALREYVVGVVIYEGVEKEFDDYIRIGRVFGNDLVIDDPRKHVHARHCAIVRRGSKFYLLQGEFSPTTKGLKRVGIHTYNLPHVFREGAYILVKDEIELKDGDTIALCYSPLKGPYKVLKFKMKPLFNESSLTEHV